ncbi:MAG: hypothetical protein HFF11_03935 [Angelakisella sp.]|jgi:DNA modification methylase|nr:hypothetical protein [Angelakisella sp.]
MDVIRLDDFPLNPVQGQVYEIIPDKTRIVASTNRLFNKYPTRYIPAVPRFAIRAYSQQGDTVLDPFCGSGTTAIEAMRLGRNALSLDIDPFARLLIRVKTAVYRKEDLALLDRVVRQMEALDPGSTDASWRPDLPNLEKWFCETSVRELAFFKEAIDRLAAENQRVRDYLYVVLAGILRRCSNAEEVSPKPYISTRYPKTPAVPSQLFYKTEALYREAITGFSREVSPYGCTSTLLESRDARQIDAGRPVDLAVTSPPYINAYDYVRSLRFEDLWLGLTSYRELQSSRGSYIGTESPGALHPECPRADRSELLAPLAEQIARVDDRRSRIVRTYFEDMAVNMEAVRQSLRPGGRYVIITGDSSIRGQTIPTSGILREMAEQNGYVRELSFRYVIRDRYLHLPRGGRGGIIHYDDVLVLRKL